MYRGREDFSFQPLGNVRRSFRVSAPLDLQFQMMGGDPAFPLFVPNAAIDGPVHPQDYLIGAERCPGLGGPSQFAIDDIADAFQHTAHEALGQNCIALWFGGLILSFSHESVYE